MKSIFACLLIVTPLVVSACALLGADGSDVDVQLSVEEQEYVATGNSGKFSFTVVARLSNLSMRPVYLRRCGLSGTQPIHHVPSSEGTPSFSAYSPVYTCGGPNIHIKVGALRNRIDTLVISGPTMRTNSNMPIGKTEGEFVLQYYVSECRIAADCPFQSVRSNTFNVKAEFDSE